MAISSNGQASVVDTVRNALRLPLALNFKSVTNALCVRSRLSANRNSVHNTLTIFRCGLLNAAYSGCLVFLGYGFL